MGAWPQLERKAALRRIQVAHSLNTRKTVAVSSGHRKGLRGVSSHIVAGIRALCALAMARWVSWFLRRISNSVP